MVTGPGHAGEREPSAENGRGRRVEDLARAAVGMVAPDEVTYFGDLSAQFFGSPARVLRSVPARGEATASGVPGGPEMITPVVVAAVSGALSDEIRELITAAARRGWRAARKLRARSGDARNACQRCPASHLRRDERAPSRFHGDQSLISQHAQRAQRRVPGDAVDLGQPGYGRYLLPRQQLPVIDLLTQVSRYPLIGR